MKPLIIVAMIALIVGGGNTMAATAYADGYSVSASPAALAIRARSTADVMPLAAARTEEATLPATVPAEPTPSNDTIRMGPYLWSGGGLLLVGLAMILPLASDRRGRKSRRSTP